MLVRHGQRLTLYEHARGPLAKSASSANALGPLEALSMAKCHPTS
jgi:hypothetical protein